MKPFVLWLEKEQIDELISLLIKNRNNSESILNKELFDINELTQLTEQLLDQNNKLVDILKDIKPLTEHEKSRVEAVGIKQKCDSYKKLMEEFEIHCKTYGKGYNTDGTPLCNDCPIITEKDKSYLFR